MLKSALRHSRSNLKFTQIAVNLSSDYVVIAESMKTAGKGRLVKVHCTVIHSLFNKQICLDAHDLNLEGMETAPAVFQYCDCFRKTKIRLLILLCIKVSSHQNNVELDGIRV